ncbi:GtrA family protein [Microbacterium sp. B2969]|uniref:GtrA family protein n=1 Tax=Microbacterium alkaliflavum TaxID=3248839 RepID=A0ABW7Q647_9MICO
MPAHLAQRMTAFGRRVWARSAIRYVVIGGVAFAFDVGLLFVLHEVLGIPLPISTPVAFLTSFCVTYLLQRIFTFRLEGRVASSAVKYTLLVIANTFAVTGIVAAVDALGGSWFAGKLLAVVAMTVWNYFAYRYWVFAPRARGHGSSHATPQPRA